MGAMSDETTQASLPAGRPSRSLTLPRLPRSRAGRALVAAAGALVLVAVGVTASMASGPEQTAQGTTGRAPAQAADQAAERAPGSAQPVALPVGFRPEGVASGPGDRYYTGSLADGRIVTGDLSEGTSEQLVAGVAGRALRGMLRDPRSGLLWVAGNDGETGIVLAVDSKSGEIRERVVVPGAVFLNDLDITRNAVWVTDSRVDRLTKLPLDRRGNLAGDLTHVPLAAPWPTPEGIRANGIRALRDGTLLLDHSTAGGLWSVNPKTGAVAEVPVTGEPAVTAGDGLVLAGRMLYVVRGSGQNEVTVLRLRRDGSTWTARSLGRITSPDLDVPATATIARGKLWAVNARFGVADPATATFSIVPLSRKPAPAATPTPSG